MEQMAIPLLDSDKVEDFKTMDGHAPGFLSQMLGHFGTSCPRLLSGLAKAMCVKPSGTPSSSPPAPPSAPRPGDPAPPRSSPTSVLTPTPPSHAPFARA
jgi:hypothetical protein